MLILVESAEGGREVAKKTVHVGRITKIVDCIRIVFGLPYNFDDLKSHSSQSVQLAKCLLRNSFAIQIGSHVAEPDTFLGYCIDEL